MSGIAGICRLQGPPVALPEIERMLATIAHRGEGADAWSEDSIGLGARRRPSACAAGPLVDPAARTAVVADARLDNREELIATLGVGGGAPADTLPDGRLILAAYARWGDRCPEHLLGDFAFALWDERRRALLCARDPFGVRPLVYHRNGRTVVFGSETKAVLAVDGVPRRPDEHRVASYLTSAAEDTRTFYADIAFLPAAHALTLDAQGGLRLVRYWQLDPHAEAPPRSDDEHAEAVRNEFSTAVARRLSGPEPLGAMLSGGLDSSSIACTARALAPPGADPLPVFSVHFSRTPAADERPFVEAVLRGGGLEPHEIDGEALTPMTDIDRLIALADGPFHAPSLPWQWGTYRAAAERGVVALLDGAGGDQAFSGLGWLAELARSGHWLRLAAEVRGLSRRHAITAPQLLWNHVMRPLAPRRLVRTVRRVRPPTRGGGFAGTSFIRPQLASLLLRDPQPDPFPRTARGRHAAEIASHGPRPVFDAAAAAWGVEPRYPFYDRPLMELLLSLPAEQKQQDGWTRPVLRRALADVLPPAVRDRTGKGNPTASLVRALLGTERERIESVLHDPPPALDRYVEVALARDMYRAYSSTYNEQGDRDAAIRPEALPLAVGVWKIVALDLWLRSGGVAE